MGKLGIGKKGKWSVWSGEWIRRESNLVLKAA
jgi:hypothetical protein